jgi:hypothetical protein
VQHSLKKELSLAVCLKLPSLALILLALYFVLVLCVVLSLTSLANMAMPPASTMVLQNAALMDDGHVRGLTALFSAMAFTHADH